MLIRPFEESDTEAVVELWRACNLTRPWNDPHRDIERKLLVQRELTGTGAGSTTWPCIRMPAARVTPEP